MKHHSVIHGHALEVLRSMPANSVHCVVTSPPYYALRNYGTPPPKPDPTAHVLGTLISWLHMELGESNARTLLDQLSPQE